MNADLQRRSGNLSLDPAFYDLLTSSYARLVGVPLVPEGAGPAWLYREARFVVLAHNNEPDPRFIYANRTAQACFEYSWDEFTTLPSRFSAEVPDRLERQQLLDAVARNGFMTGYCGLRVAKSGRHFRINDGTIWQLIDEAGTLHGQGAVFSSWSDAWAI